MKKVIFLLIITLSNIVFSQTVIKGMPFSASKNTSYDFLLTILKNKKLVLLGEQSHGDGAIFDEKVTLIKYLHEKLGFNTIAFESGMYDNYKAYQEFSSKKQNSSIFNQSIFSIWADTKSFQNLIQYVDERAKLKDTIKIIGFDSQVGTIFNNNYIDDLKQTLKKRKIKISEKTFTKIEKVFVHRDFDIIANSKKDSLDLVDNYNLILNSFKSLKDISLHEKMMRQAFISSINDVDFSIKQLQKQKIVVQNPRDEQMAKNLIFLSELDPSEKIIGWAASYHFARNLDQYEYSSLTENYFNQQAELEKKFTGQTEYKLGDCKEMLKGSIPMGQIIKNYFKDTMYSLAFSSYDGVYGVVNEKTFPILTPPEESIEKQLYDTENEKVFFNFNLDNQEGFYSSALGNIPMKAKWNNVFDGLFFIKTAYQPESRTYEKSTFVNSEIVDFKISGSVVNSKTNRVISNVDILISNTNKIYKSNQLGEFTISVPKDKISENIIISSQGCLNDTISVAKLIQDNRNILKIRLKPYITSGYLLKEVVLNVSNKELTAKQILAKVYKNIESNYDQNSFNQTFYFKSEMEKNGENSINTEAFIKNYMQKGMVGFESPQNYIYADIKQLKNVKNKTNEYFFTSSNSFAFLFSRDLILTKANVLYRTDSYSLKNEGEMIYEDKNVYKISFNNNSPGSYSTGFGYPAPKNSSGYLLINVDDFSVLKYEHCVVRQPYELKDKRMMNSKHKIVATYKKTDNYYFIDLLTEITKKEYSPSYDNDINKVVNIIYSKNTIKSFEISTKNIEIIDNPLLNLGIGKSFTEDSEFWNSNNFINKISPKEIENCN